MSDQFATKQYVLGRGKVYFSRFQPGTQLPKDFLYLGNTPEFNLSIESEDLVHMNADEGVREEDDSVTLETMRSITLVTDNISAHNMALFLLGTSAVVTQAPVAAQTESIADVILGHSYTLGLSQANPTGFKGIDTAGFAVTVGGTFATGTLTIAAGNAAANDTVTVGGRTYTFVTALTAANQVLVGGSSTASAANLAAAVNAAAGAGTTYGAGTVANAVVSAAAAAGVVTFTARAPGVAGNAVSLVRSGTNLTVSGATLSGATAGAALVAGEDYDMDFDTGMISLRLSSTRAVTGDELSVTYAVRGSSRTQVLSGNVQIEGALRFVAKNAKGPSAIFDFPWVKLSPNGEMTMKGDDWQSISLNGKVLKQENRAAILRDGFPVFA